MAIAYSIHGHSPIPFMAMALFHSWPRLLLMAKALLPAHPIAVPSRTSLYI